MYVYSATVGCTMAFVGILIFILEQEITKASKLGGLHVVQT